MEKLDRQDFGEREIVTGLTVSQEFAEMVCPMWQDQWLQAPENQKLARWSMDHFTQHGKVLGTIHALSLVFLDHMQREGLSKAEGELIEKVLTHMEETFQDSGGIYDVETQYARAVTYFRRRELEDGIGDAEPLLLSDVDRAISVLSAAALRAETMGLPADKLPDPWGDPEPLPLDISRLPSFLPQFADTVADVIGCETSALAWSLLAACAGALDGSIRLQMKPNDRSFAVSPFISLLLTGPASSLKSPILKPAFAPLRRIDLERSIEYNRAKARWDEADKATRGPEPRRRQLMTSTPTIEGIRDALVWQDSGIIAYSEEWSSHIGSMGRYGGGNAVVMERGFFNTGFDGGYWSTNRANKVIEVKNLLIAVVAGVQPKILQQFNRRGELTADGMIQRCCPILMGPLKLGRTDIDTEGLYNRYERLIRRLVNVPGNRTLQLTPEAQEIRLDVEKRLLEMMQWNNLGDGFTTAVGKLHGYWGRFAHTLEHIMCKHDQRNTLTEVGVAAAALAEWLMFQSLVPNMIRFYRDALGSGDMDIARMIASFLIRKRRATVTATEIVQNIKVIPERKVENVPDAIAPLVGMGWVTPQGHNERQARAWAVNQRIYVQFPERAAEEGMRAARDRTALAEAKASTYARVQEWQFGGPELPELYARTYRCEKSPFSSEKQAAQEGETNFARARVQERQFGTSSPLHPHRVLSLKEKVVHNAMVNKPARDKERLQDKPTLGDL